jgi:hypothetical protein
MTGQELRQRRIAAGLSTSQMAALSGLPEAAVVFFETQARIPKRSLRSLLRGLWVVARDRALGSAPVPPCPQEQAFAARGFRDAGAFVAHTRGCTTCGQRREHVFATAGRPPLPGRTERAFARLDRLPWPVASAGQGAVALGAAALPVGLLTMVIGVLAQEGEVFAMGLGGVFLAAGAGLVGGPLYAAFRRLVPGTYAGAWAAWMAVWGLVAALAYAALVLEGEVEPGSAGAVRVALGAVTALAAAGTAWVTWRLEAVRLPWAGGPARPTWSPFRALALAGLVAAVVLPMMLGAVVVVAESAAASAYDEDFTTDTTAVAVLPPVVDTLGAAWAPDLGTAVATLQALHSVSPEAAERFAMLMEAQQPGLGLADSIREMVVPLDSKRVLRTREYEEQLRAGERAYDDGRWDVALASYRMAAFLDPSSAEVWIRRAEAARAVGMFDEARQAVLAAQALDPDATADGRVRTLSQELTLPLPGEGVEMDAPSAEEGVEMAPPPQADFSGF